MNTCKPISLILCAVDLSEVSARTLREAVNLAEKLGASLHVLHVVNERLFEGLERRVGRGGEMANVLENAVAAMEEERAQGLKELLIECEAKKVSHTSQVTMGLPWERILEVSDQQGADLIIMGATGRGGLVRQLRFGSSAEKVFRRSRCRVMFVR